MNRQQTVYWATGKWAKSEWKYEVDDDKIEERKKVGQEKDKTVKRKIKLLLGIKSEVQVPILAKQIDTGVLSFDDLYIARHGVSKEDATKWVQNALFTVDVWEKKYTRFNWRKWRSLC